MSQLSGRGGVIAAALMLAASAGLPVSGQAAGGAVGDARTVNSTTSAGVTTPATLQRLRLESFALRHLNGGYGTWRRTRYPNGPGWTHAQVQRMARKRRNQARHRAAHKRAGR